MPGNGFGCADCHTPRLGSVEGIYSDLLLHDMGLELSDSGAYYSDESESLGAATSRAGPGVHISASGGQLNPATVNSLPALVRHDVFAAIADAIQHVFIWALPAAVIIFVLAWFIKEVPLRGRAPSAEAPSQEPELVS